MYIPVESSDSSNSLLQLAVEHAYLFSAADYNTALHYAAMADILSMGGDAESARFARLCELQLQRVCCDQEMNALNSAAVRAKLGHE